MAAESQTPQRLNKSKDPALVNFLANFAILSLKERKKYVSSLFVPSTLAIVNISYMFLCEREHIGFKLMNSILLYLIY